MAAFYSLNKMNSRTTFGSFRKLTEFNLGYLMFASFGVASFTVIGTHFTTLLDAIPLSVKYGTSRSMVDSKQLLNSVISSEAVELSD